MKLAVNRLRYRSNGAWLVDDVTFEVASGGLTAVIGPNGAGKSTLLHLIAGDLQPTSGTVEYDGTDLSEFNVGERAANRAVLVQQSSADISFTTHQVISMGRYPYRFDPRNTPDADRAAIASAIRLLDLEGLLHRQVRSLSGGEQQRVAIARILAQQTPIVLLDEPTTALDIGHQEAVMALIEALGGEGTSVVAVLHDLNMASHFERVIVLNEGRIAAAGSPSDVLTSELLTSVYGYHIDVVDHPTRPGLIALPELSHRPNIDGLT